MQGQATGVQTVGTPAHLFISPARGGWGIEVGDLIDYAVDHGDSMLPVSDFESLVSGGINADNICYWIDRWKSTMLRLTLLYRAV